LRATSFGWLGLLVACSGGGEPGSDTTPDETGSSVTSCAYPDGASDVMTRGEVMPAFSWPDARHLDGRTASLDLSSAPCNDDDDIDWSPFDVLVFISIPAW